MNPINGKRIIASGEDGGAFVYEPSWNHTLISFQARMDKRIAAARKNQDAFVAEEARLNGSINVLPAPAKSCVGLSIPHSYYGD